MLGVWDGAIGVITFRSTLVPIDQNDSVASSFYLNSSGYRTHKSKSRDQREFNPARRRVGSAIASSSNINEPSEMVSDRAHTRTVTSTIFVSHVYLKGDVKAAAA